MYQKKDLESVIPPDWRQFRARLVADEKWREDQTKAMAKSSFKRFFLPPAADDGYPAAKETSEFPEHWAHPIHQVEHGSVLIANEKLGGVFSRAVVLMLSVGHGKSTGVVINRPLDGTLKDAADCNVAKPIQSTFASSTVSYGGPVKEEDLAILHSNPIASGSREIIPGVFVGGSEGLRKLVCLREFHPTKALFTRGRAEWIPGQLDREIDRGVWRVASASPSLILRHASAGREQSESGLWNDILTTMGGEYANISDNFR
ncbi:hypothetical protein TrRE_jg6010 [Triparma retinervis]|uniref:Transcriptional regulator n=1 Tax=Triparma retinervis TaxID=2557542 RepID=A0A9W7A479_9STRA|nr:hypothetical protein TrRE_jg6010 [Triparma retinervis]